MSDFSSFGNDLKLLSDLLNSGRNDSSDDEEHVTKKSTNTYRSPADIANQATTKTNLSDGDKKEIKPSPYQKTETEKTDINFEDEYNDKVRELTDESTWKKCPSWDISYRQSVSASDIYLQMSNKTCATSSCEVMVITISLPDESRQTIDLKILKTELILSSSKYFLKISLPQPVNPQLGEAKFDSDTQSLAVSLVMERELDFVNY